MSKLRLPIGQDNFGEILEKGLDFVDKTLLIQEIIDDPSSVMVITRPRRFGKTLNLSMLQHFFAADVYGRKTQGLFDRFKIASLGEQYMQYQGKHPVIFLTLKDVKDHNLQVATGNLHELIRRTYREHRYVLDGGSLDVEEKVVYHKILAKQASESEIHASLRNLTEYIFRHTTQRVWLLIDEYDAPIQSAFVHDYYLEMISLMRGVLSAVLKTNPYLEKVVITGILRIAKESLFSGLNNVQVYTLLHSGYSEYFGFTESEVVSLLQQANLEYDSVRIRGWYNGYQCGNTVIYNPWSIVSCIKNQGEVQPYWVNTSGNELIKRQLAKGDVALKENLAKLLRNEPVSAIIEENTVFGDLDNNNDAVWSLLLFSGYLKATDRERREFDTCINVQLIAPNHEVLLLYRGIIYGWFSDKLGNSTYQSFLKHLTEGHVEAFGLGLQDCLEITFSLFDVTGRHPEKFYHGFVLGLIVSLQATHEVQSNKESGDGRYDVMLIPKDPTQLGIVMEFKTIRNAAQSLEEAAEEALQQIIDRRYAATLKSHGIVQVLQIGLAFYHKKVRIASNQ